MAAGSFDVIVIGAGPGGYVAAIRAAQLGLRAAVVERESLGGICLNWGCIPTKAMLRSAEVLRLMRHAADFGLSAQGVGFDLGAVVARSRAVAKQLSAGVAHLLRKNGVTVIMGTARLAGPAAVAVVDAKGAEQVLSAGAVILATGARARELPGLEADGDLVWTYRQALVPKRMPKRLLVIGSGAIGIEFASFFTALGAETTVVEVLDRILPAEDAEISAFARRQFEKQGMTFLEKASVKALDRRPGQGVTAHIETGGRIETRDFDTVISAVGIVGNIEGLGLEAAGVRVERSHVVTDDHCRTGVPGLYAIGDLAGAPWLAHKASHEGVMVAELIAGGTPHPVRPEAIPGCTYCHPQVASVGLTEEKARATGREVRVGRFPFIGNGKAIALGEPEGLVKTVFDAKTGELLGAHMVGAEVTELIQGYVIGRALETTEAELMQAVFPHPTLSEAMHEAVLDAYGRAIHF
jgi:dihydrolipoamide dehydrogenase